MSNDDEFKSVRLCGMAPIPGRGFVDVRTLTGSGVTRAGIVGTMSCKSASGPCPVCAPAVREQRRLELQDRVVHGLKTGYRFLLVTGTLRHTRDSTVAQQRKTLEMCWKAITTGKAAQRRKESGAVAGTVRAFEFTLDGPAGPHGHMHAVVLVRPGTEREAVAAAMVEMGKRWRTVAARGMDGLAPDAVHGWDWEWARSPEQVTDYVALTREVARGDMKRPGRESVTPFGLLAHAVEQIEAGNVGPMLRMAEYARAVKGMRCIVASRAWVSELGKPPANAEENEAAGEDWQTVITLTAAAWLLLARGVGVRSILSAAVSGGKPAILAIMAGLEIPP